MRYKTLAVAFFSFMALLSGISLARGETPTLDWTTFIERLTSMDHLASPIDGKTEMSSTWDREGANDDGLDFKRIEGDKNILLDVDGPGCVHRIFTGMLGKHVQGTQIRIYLDGNDKPTFDMPVEKFFDDKNGPIPYPFVFHKTYPGTLFPIPFARHCRIELYNPAKKNWGNYWQVTYTIYSKDTPVKTLQWPLSESEQQVLRNACQSWLQAESSPPPTPEKWTFERTVTLAPKAAEEIRLEDAGVIRQLRLHASPSTPETLGNVKMQIHWDGDKTPAVDMPIGYFFGNVATGYVDQFFSLPMGVANEYAYCRLPMPFAKGAVVRLVNDSDAQVSLRLNILVDPSDAAAVESLGRFHATLQKTEVAEKKANFADLPHYGKKNYPVHKVLELDGKKGKYVGVFLHVDWPHEKWWGEGDWLIWTDENGWPPSYHGTGSEEYFNSGWCLFDRKAVSGIIREPKMRPGHVGVYSFHLNDSFSFTNNIRVAVEILTTTQRKATGRAFWRSTAFWYEYPPTIK